MTKDDRFAAVRQVGRGSAADRLHRLFDLAWAQRLEDAPELATLLGVDGYGDRWSDLSPEAVAARRARAGAPLEALLSVDRDELGPEDRLSWDVFAHQARDDADTARYPNEHLMAVGPLGHPAAEVAATLAAMPLATRDQLDDVLARLRGVPALLEQATALLDEGLALGVTPPAITLRDVPASVRAHLAVGDDPRTSPLLTPLRERIGAPPPDEDAVLAEAAAIVAAEVEPALRRHLAHLERTYVPAARGTTAMADLPDGASWYASLARSHTTTTMAVADIHELGHAEVARVGAAMDEVMASTGFPGDRAGFAAFLRTDPQFRFPSGEALLTAYRDVAKRVDLHVARLFRTLPRLPFAVVPVPAESAPTAPVAYYQPGSPDHGRAGQFFANTAHLDSRLSWNMESICIHEAVPGHHFQIALAQELGELPAFRAHALFTAYVEGWGLYCEGLGEELGLYTDPYQRFGALDAEMLRSIRLVVDTGLHALGWSRQQAIDYFLEHSVTTEQEVVVEVDRYLTMPGQALAYKVGERRISALRAEVAAALGEAFDVRDLHDEVLRHGALPLDLLGELVRARFQLTA